MPERIAGGTGTARTVGFGALPGGTAPEEGPLRRELRLEDGIVTACRIDTPTERKCRSGGPVAAGPIWASAEDLELAAKPHVQAIDPCVEFRVVSCHA